MRDGELADCGGVLGVTRVLAKEVAPFGIRTLTVVAGTFNTGFADNAVVGKEPLPADYEGSACGQMVQYLKSGKVPIHGDKDKAMKALYEVVTGQGVGVGLEAEKLLPLGTDMTARVQGARDILAHSLEVFGHVTDSVGIDG